MSRYKPENIAMTRILLERKVYPTSSIEGDQILCSEGDFRDLSIHYNHALDKCPKWAQDLHKLYDRLGIVDIEREIPIAAWRSRSQLKRQYFTNLGVAGNDQPKILKPSFRINGLTPKYNFEEEGVFLASYNLMERLETDFYIRAGDVLAISPIIFVGPRTSLIL